MSFSNEYDPKQDAKELGEERRERMTAFAAEEQRLTRWEVFEGCTTVADAEKSFRDLAATITGEEQRALRAAAKQDLASIRTGANNDFNQREMVGKSLQFTDLIFHFLNVEPLDDWEFLCRSLLNDGVTWTIFDVAKRLRSILRRAAKKQHPRERAPKIPAQFCLQCSERPRMTPSKRRKDNKRTEKCPSCGHSVVRDLTPHLQDGIEK